jgi:hypothetical protein
MNVQEAKEFIKEWSDWNVSQVSDSMAFHGVRSVADDILDERRQVLLNAYKIVRKHLEAAND